MQYNYKYSLCCVLVRGEALMKDVLLLRYYGTCVGYLVCGCGREA